VVSIASEVANFSGASPRSLSRLGPSTTHYTGLIAA